jgi:hypothetical protein
MNDPCIFFGGIGVSGRIRLYNAIMKKRFTAKEGEKACSSG